MPRFKTGDVADAETERCSFEDLGLSPPLLRSLKDWADLREDKMINLGSGFGPIFGPLGITAGPGGAPPFYVAEKVTNPYPRF